MKKNVHFAALFQSVNSSIYIETLEKFSAMR